MDHYHKRSNVESTFSMMNRKFGDAVRSKNDVAMVNEALCKILAHNLCYLIQEQCELGIETEFGSDEESDQNTFDAETTACNEMAFAEMEWV
jgi:hypothetical protein